MVLAVRVGSLIMTLLAGKRLSGIPMVRPPRLLMISVVCRFGWCMSDIRSGARRRAAGAAAVPAVPPTTRVVASGDVTPSGSSSYIVRFDGNNNGNSNSNGNGNGNGGNDDNNGNGNGNDNNDDDDDDEGGSGNNGLGNVPYPATLPGGGPVTVDVRPIFECWAPVGNHYTAFFSYENFSKQGTRLVGVKIGRGSSNRLTPALGVDLPERFGVVAGRPGRTAFGIALPKAFVVRNWNGTNTLVRKLGTRTATTSTTIPVPVLQTTAQADPMMCGKKGALCS
jgi:hypothetical protein